MRWGLSVSGWGVIAPTRGVTGGKIRKRTLSSPFTRKLRVLRASETSTFLGLDVHVRPVAMTFLEKLDIRGSATLTLTVRPANVYRLIQQAEQNLKVSKVSPIQSL